MIPNCGKIGGKLETEIDEKGRVAIPKKLRVRAGFRKGVKIKLSAENGRITMSRPITRAEFIRELEGCIKRGSALQAVKPLDLKRIWEKS